MNDLPTTWQSFEQRIRDAKDAAELAGIEHALFGRKAGAMTLALSGLGNLPPEERRAKAQELNTRKRALAGLLEERTHALSAPSAAHLTEQDGIDVTLDLPARERGHLHLIPEFIAQVEEVFGRMGFAVADGPEIETEELNFNLLNIPRTHPARDLQDTFWIKGKNAEERLLLRTQTSPMQIRYMQSHTPPFRVIAPGKVYRKDSDATHSPMFHQFEGLMIGKDVTLANMKAVMITAIRELTFSDAEFRFRTGFFPFVEPGLEVDMRWRGTSLASDVPGDSGHPKEGLWLEVVGCGMVHPQVLINCGINPPMGGKPRHSRVPWQGFAFGFGVERMIMIKHQIPDLRAFYLGDVRFLRQF